MPRWLDTATDKPQRHGWYPVLLGGEDYPVPGACWWTGQQWAEEGACAPTHWWPEPQPAAAPAEFLALDLGQERETVLRHPEAIAA